MEPLVGFLIAVAGAFTGAWAAFKLQDAKQSKETIDGNIAAVNRALYTLFNLWNIQRQYQLEVIDPIRGARDVWLNMIVTPPSSSYGLSKFQAEELSFLLQTNHANVYADLLLEEQRFEIAMIQIEARATIILNQVFPRMGAAQIQPGQPVVESDLEKLLGVDVVHKLKQMSSNIITHIDENTDSIREVHDRLRSAAKEMYPKKKIISIGFDEPKEGAT